MLLTNSIVCRAGASAGYSNTRQEPNAKLEVIKHNNNEGFNIWFTIPAAGGGETNIQIVVDSQDFHILKEVMDECQEDMLRHLKRQIQTIYPGRPHLGGVIQQLRDVHMRLKKLEKKPNENERIETRD